MSILHKIHAKLGDFWWYSLMLFCAMRAADALNVFVGLWLVPKYVEPSELGAVLPLTQFAAFLAIPIGVFSSTFRNELTSLAVNRKFGQMKTLMRGVFIATAVFFVLAIVVCRFILPAYLERIRVAEGSLGLIILMTSLINAVAPIYGNAIQALKKFKANSAIAFIGAPLRLITMLITMPFRALTGYFVGQNAVPASQIVGSLICLRKELSVPAEPYWNRGIIRRFGRLFLIFGVSAVAGGISGLVENTVLRQRLPELDSAAYYMVTRFSDISGFLATALVFTLFPYTAELAAKGKDTRPILTKVTLAVLLTNIALAAFFCLFGERILAILPHGSEYAAYWWAIPWLVMISPANTFINIYTTGEVSAFRCGYMKWMIPLTLLYPVSILLVTGYGYFSAYLPASWTEFLATHNLTSLSAMLWWMTGIAVLKTLGCALAMLLQGPHCATKPDVLSYPHAKRTGNALYDGQLHDGGGLHPLSSRRERALSDLSRVRVLAEKIPSELLRVAQRGEGTALRELTAAIVSAAKTDGLYRPYTTLRDFGERKRQRSGESEIFATADNAFILKVKDPTAKQSIKRTSPSDWLYEHVIHNILFPDTPYEFAGITEQLGTLRIILQQTNVEAVARPTDAQIAAHLDSLGLKPEDRYFFGNNLLAVTDVSASSDNVLLDDSGHLRFIDPLIRLKKPAIEVIDRLINATA